MVFIFYFCSLIAFTAVLDSFLYQQSFWKVLFRLVTYPEHRPAIFTTLFMGLAWSGMNDWRSRKRERNL